MMSRIRSGSWACLVSFGAVGSLVALVACNTDADAPDYFGDTTGSAGYAASGGSSASGGSTAGMGGAIDVGGSAGEAGSHASGGTGGSGTGGMAGASGAGGAGGSGSSGGAAGSGSSSGVGGSGSSGGTAGSGASGGTAGSGGSSGAAGSGGQLQWRTANLTNFTSYPEPGSEECVDYNGCEWAGYFAALDDQQTEQWVESHNIAAVHSKDFDEYKLKTLRLRQDAHEIDVVVYDMCADSDCSGCCTQNASETGFLIDLESYTAERFGSGDGIVEWVCLDC